jgi:hypothetical protein
MFRKELEWQQGKAGFIRKYDRTDHPYRTQQISFSPVSKTTHQRWLWG